MLGQNKFEVRANSDSIRKGVICNKYAICPIYICDIDYLFVIKVRSIGKTISPNLEEISKLSERSIELSQFNYMALYAVANKKLISLYVTSTSYSFFDISRLFKFKDDDRL